MILKTRIFLLAVALVVSSCNVFKKSTDNGDDLVVMNLDTIETTSTNIQVEQYHASETRLSDILHTKLDVSFDWTKQYMFGKATITVKPYFYPTSTLLLDARGMEIKEVSLVKKEYQKTGMDSKKNPMGQYEATVSEVETKSPLKYGYENYVITIQKTCKHYANTM